MTEHAVRLPVDWSSFVKVLIARRVALGLSQWDLDELVGSTRGTVCRWERSAIAAKGVTPDTFSLFCWCQALRLTFAILATEQLTLLSHAVIATLPPPSNADPATGQRA